MTRQETAWRWKTGGLLGLTVFAFCHAAIAQPAPATLPFDEDDFKIRMWQATYEIRGMLGYKDNVTLSSSSAEGSGFWMSRAEAMFFRLPSKGWQFTFFATADDIRYFDASANDNEQVAMAVAQLNKDFGHGWKSTLDFNYLYQNQAFDMSAVYTKGGSIGVIQGQMLAPRWSARKTLGQTWVELEFNATRQIMSGLLDSYWTTGPRLTSGLEYGRGSELALAYQWVHLGYDTREQSDLVGVPLTNTVLALRTHAVELAWTHVWDQQRRWQTTTRLGCEANLDNGSGYYDYTLYRAYQQVRYRAPSWEATAQAGVGFYDYANQTVSATDPSPRQRTLVTFSLRAEKKLTKHLKVHANYSLDRSVSEMAFDDYLANTILGGFGFEF